VQELQSQYEGGVGAYVTGALNYSIDLEELAEAAWPTLPEATVAEAKNFYEWVLKEKRNTFGLSEKAFITCDSLKRLWRAATSQISGYWPELKDTAIEAIESPGKTLKCRRVAMRRDGAWLRVVMPSGRCLCYMSPRVEGSDRDARITYMGINNYTRQWQRLGTYGGKLFENICQSFAGDILKANMGHIEDAGYEIVLSVHDELVCYAPDTDQYTAEHLAALMARVPEWAPGMPLAAAGFECYRYRKE
jgi:DNA polymerase